MEQPIGNPYQILFEKMQRIENMLTKALEKNPPTEDLILTKSETAEYLKCSVQTVTNLVKTGQLEPSNVGRNLKFRKSDLDRYLDQNK